MEIGSGASHPASRAWRCAAFFLLGLVVLDQAGGAVLDVLFARSRSGETAGAVNEALAHDAEIFVFGSSRAVHHVDTDVLAGEFGCSAFNAGANGQSAWYAVALEHLLLGRGRRPRLFLLQVEPKDLYFPRLDRIKVLAPYWGENAFVDELLTRTDRFARLKLSSRLYRYNSRALAVVRAGLSGAAPAGSGFEPLVGRLDPAKWPQRAPRELLGVEEAPPPEGAEPYRAFAKAARSESIPVVWFTGPRWRGGEPKLASERMGEAVLREVAAETGGRFLDLDERALPEFEDVRWYRDPGHLNAQGARAFTRVLVRKLRELRFQCVRPG